MGDPNFPCFKPQSPFLEWTTTTTATSTSTTIEPDYFIIPPSGTICKYQLIEASQEVANVID
jgi:hypothetical protein